MAHMVAYLLAFLWSSWQQYTFHFDRECCRYKPLTPKALLPSSFARTNLICYNVWWRIWTVSGFKVMGERISSGVRSCNNVIIIFQLCKIIINLRTKTFWLRFKTVIKLTMGWAGGSWLRQGATIRKVPADNIKAVTQSCVSSKNVSLVQKTFIHITNFSVLQHINILQLIIKTSSNNLNKMYRAKYCIRGVSDNFKLVNRVYVLKISI